MDSFFYREKESAEKMHSRYMNDSFLKQCNKVLSEIYLKSMPIGIKDGILIYNEKTTKAIKELEQTIKEYTKKTIQEL